MKRSNFINNKMFSCLVTILCLCICSTSIVWADPANGLSESQKEIYYNEYIKLAEEVSQSTGENLEVIPMDEFTEEDWVTPEEFKIHLINMANLTFEPVEEQNMGSGIIPLSLATASKDAQTKVLGETVVVTINGSFNTQFNETLQRQLFDGINSISSYKKSGTGTWKHTGYSVSVLDGKRTYKIIVTGKYTVGAVTKDASASVFFYCSGNGGVS